MSFAVSAGNMQRMSVGLKKANDSTFWPYKMSAVLFKGSKPIICGTNRPSPGINKDRRYVLNQSIHAELSLVVQAAKNGISLKGKDIYVSGVSKAGNLVKSKPCPTCERVLRESGVRSVFYHEKDGSLVRFRL